jgi:hypothetical protein
MNRISGFFLLKLNVSWSTLRVRDGSGSLVQGKFSFSWLEGATLEATGNLEKQTSTNKLQRTARSNALNNKILIISGILFVKKGRCLICVGIHLIIL